MRYDQELYEELKQDRYKVEKYLHSGIYSISATKDEQVILLYIGKSANILQRISAHISHIKKPYCKESYQNKYKVFRQFQELGYDLQFDVLSYSTLSLLDQQESNWIIQCQPPLCYQIPKMTGGWTVNPKAKCISAKEILHYER